MRKYKRSDLIHLIAEKTQYHEHNIREIYLALEEIVEDLLLSATETDDVEIRILYGVGLYSTFVPEHKKRMPSGELLDIEDSLQFTAKFSTRWKKSRRKLYAETNKLWKKVKKRS